MKKLESATKAPEQSGITLNKERIDKVITKLEETKVINNGDAPTNNVWIDFFAKCSN